MLSITNKLHNTIMLPLEKIEELETFISQNKPAEYLPCLSSLDIKNALTIYIETLNMPNNTYEIFGNAGFTTYAIYKSSNNKMYIISVFIQTLESYIEINNADVLS